VTLGLGVCAEFALKFLVPKLAKNKIFSIGFALVPLLFLTGCGEVDVMPAPRVDIFVLDLSSSNDKQSQLNRLGEDLNQSLTNNPLGIPKEDGNKEVTGPVTTIFTFIEDVALRAETFKVQDAQSTIDLWDSEFAKDSSRNSRSWEVVSSLYDDYLDRHLMDGNQFSISTCEGSFDDDLADLFNSDSKRALIVTPLCKKISEIVIGYEKLQNYVTSTNAPATDIFGTLGRIDRLVAQIKEDNPSSIITINFGSDMQHETGDSRDTPKKLAGVNYSPTAVCELARSDKQREGFKFDQVSTVKVNGIGNANITAQYGTALVKYWECFFSASAEIR
jgi:hypothetical protein